MIPANLVEPLTFLLETVFNLYIVLVLIRFLMQWLGADFFNPIAQFIVKVTNPVLAPLRMLLPKGGKYDIASLIGLFALQALYGFLIGMLQGRGIPINTLLFWSLAELVDLFIQTFVVMIFIRVLLSWVNPGGYNPVVALLYNLTDPLMKLGQRLIPPIGGIDLSPIVILIGLQFLGKLIIPTLHQLAMTAPVVSF
jgi:YggT family protein